MQANRSIRGNDVGRRGFTLLEILVAVSILAILVGILVPAIQQARRAARLAQIRTDIRALEAGLAEFRATHNWDPPSKITLCEDASQWSSYPESVAAIRQIWNNFDFDYTTNPTGDGAGFCDINRNGVANETLTLTGAECLVFFLGGLPDPGTTQPNGFSKNSRVPFAPGGAREAPFFPFTNLVPGANGFAVYLGPVPSALNTPIISCSSGGGAGYLDEKPLPDGPNGDLAIGSVDDLDCVYLDPNGAVPFKRDTYQIIHPGFDGFFGNGGILDPSDTSTLAEGDYDNVTNFSEGMLVP